jgi:Calcineurin-like phosphoesterase
MRNLVSGFSLTAQGNATLDFVSLSHLRDPFRLIREALCVCCCAAFLAAGPGLAAQSLVPPTTLNFPQFKTGQPLHMVAYGDMRFTNPARTTGTNPRVRKWLVERIARERPSVILLTGDMPYVGARTADWRVYESETTPWRNIRALVLPTLGNHETYGNIEQGIANYLNAYPQIHGHLYYSALLGSVEVISLDCTGVITKSSVQGIWFANQLDQVPSQVDFVLILFHYPLVADWQSQIFARMPDKASLIVRDILEAHLPTLRAKVVVFNGHIHNYERFERSGVEYIVSGGGGAEPYPILFRGSEDLYKDRGFPVYHYLTVDVANHQLHAVMWKVTDPDAPNLTVEAKDQFTLVASPLEQGNGKSGP